MSEIVSREFYSNCFIEVVKAKIKHPIRTKITVIPPKYNEVPCPHFLWSDGENDYDFGVERLLKWWEYPLFRGAIRKRQLGWNEAYKKRRIERYKRWQRRK